MSQQKIYTKRAKCVLQESCKTVRRWQIYSARQGRSLRRRLENCLSVSILSARFLYLRLIENTLHKRDSENFGFY